MKSKRFSAMVLVLAGLLSLTGLAKFGQSPFRFLNAAHADDMVLPSMPLQGEVLPTLLPAYQPQVENSLAFQPPSTTPRGVPRLQPSPDPFSGPSFDISMGVEDSRSATTQMRRYLQLMEQKSRRMSDEELEAAVNELQQTMTEQDKEAEAALQASVGQLEKLIADHRGTDAAAAATAGKRAIENALKALKNNRQQ